MGNGQGSAYKRGSTWTAEVTSFAGNQKHRKRKGGFRTRTDALAYIPTLRQQMDDDINQGAKKRPNRDEITLSDLFPVFTETKLNGKSPELIKRYMKAYSRIESIQNVPVSDLMLDDLQSCVDGLTHEQGKYIKTLLRGLFELAIIQGITSVNLGQYVTIAKEENKETEPFTIDEIYSIWDGWNNGDMFCGYILILIYSAMMPGELLQTTWSMVDLERCTITGSGLKTEERKKNPVVFASCVVPIFETLKKQADSFMLCPYTKDQFNRRFKRSIKECGCRPLNPYSCRHTTGTAMAELNVNPIRMQKVMRHAKLETTMRYVHPDSEFAQAGVDELSSISKENA